MKVISALLPWLPTTERYRVIFVEHPYDATVGADALVLHTPVATRGRDLSTVASFEVGEGDLIRNRPGGAHGLVNHSR